MTHTTNNTQTEIRTEIADMRDELDTHRKEAMYLIEHDMFHSSYIEINKCIILSYAIAAKLIEVN